MMALLFLATIYVEYGMWTRNKTLLLWTLVIHGMLMSDDARYILHGREVDGRRITVELARGLPRGPGGVREYIGRGPAPGLGRCFNCGLDGHWARDCKAGEWKNKCYRCGESRHIEKNSKNSPNKIRNGRSYSRSPVRSRSPRRGRGHSRSYSRSPSYSRSRSPAMREPVEREVSGRRSPRYSSRSPDLRRGSGKSRNRSLTPVDDETNNGRGDRESHSPERERLVKDEEDEERSPSPAGRGKSQSPAAALEDRAAGSSRYESYDDDDDGFEVNGNSRSPSPRDNDRSPAAADVE